MDRASSSWASWLAAHLQGPEDSPAVGSTEHQAPGLQEPRQALASEPAWRFFSAMCAVVQTQRGEGSEGVRKSPSSGPRCLVQIPALPLRAVAFGQSHDSSWPLCPHSSKGSNVTLLWVFMKIEQPKFPRPRQPEKQTFSRSRQDRFVVTCKYLLREEWGDAEVWRDP